MKSRGKKNIEKGETEYKAWNRSQKTLSHRENMTYHDDDEVGSADCEKQTEKCFWTEISDVYWTVLILHWLLPFCCDTSNENWTGFDFGGAVVAQQLRVLVQILRSVQWCHCPQPPIAQETVWPWFLKNVHLSGGQHVRNKLNANHKWICLAAVKLGKTADETTVTSMHLYWMSPVLDQFSTWGAWALRGLIKQLGGPGHV